MFAPLPQAGTAIDAVQMRGQLNGLKDLIDAIQTITAAQVDATNTLPPGIPAQVVLVVTDGVLHFTFDVPLGSSGSDGGQGARVRRASRASKACRALPARSRSSNSPTPSPRTAATRTRWRRWE